MAFLLDRRPTLASWPKRIYDWAELPEPFRPALEEWRRLGMPPGNVTYIPRVYQYADGPEFATAWMGDEVLLQTLRGNAVEPLRFRWRDVAAADYDVQLLHCTVSITLDRARGGLRGSFSYNKTMESQLLPILLLALGGSPDQTPRVQHPDTPALRRLLEDSYAMYNLSKLCYRFGDEILDFVWLLGKNQGFAQWGRQKPECLVARMERGIAWLQKGSYGTRMLCLPWEHLRRLRLEERRGRPVLCLEGDSDAAVSFPLADGQRPAAESFLGALPAAGEDRPAPSA